VLRKAYSAVMSIPTSLPVDLVNPADIRAKLPQFEQILVEREQAVREQQDELDRWRRLVAVLRGVAGVPAPAVAQGGQATAAENPAATTGPKAASEEAAATGRAELQALVLEAINRVGRPIRSRDLRAMLVQEGHDLNLDSVSNALWYAAVRLGSIRKMGRGVYAPLQAAPEEPAPSPPSTAAAGPHGSSEEAAEAPSADHGPPARRVSDFAPVIS
jgi:hypothetical protein